MRLTVDNMASLSGANLEIAGEIVRYFTIENPAFVEAERMGRRTDGLHKTLSFCQEIDGALIFPRGAGRAVHKMAMKYGPVEIIDNRLERPEIDLQFKGTLRAYQQQAAAFTG